MARDIAGQLAQGEGGICGLMMESFLVEGRQDLREPDALIYGQSITDACIDFPTTERVLLELAHDAAARRPLVA